MRPVENKASPAVVLPMMFSDWPKRSGSGQPISDRLIPAMGDSTTGFILEQGAGAKKLQVGSLTKIATAMVVLDWATATKADLGQLATISDHAAQLGNGQGVGLQAGDQCSLRDLLYAALMQSDNVAAEAIAEHVGGEVGDRGRMFTGPGPYRLHFPKGRLPPVDGFWSLTMYEGTPDGQFFLVANPANRYSIGDRTAGLKTNPDGSLDIWIARADPGGAKSSNWLPAPASGPFTMSLRAYLPRKEMLGGRYRVPAITKA